MKQRGSRLMLLLGLVIAAGAAAFLFFVLQGQVGQGPNDVTVVPTEIPNVNVVVARIDIPRGVVITDTETYLTLEPIGQDLVDANPEGYLRDVNEARDRLTTSTISRGSYLAQTDLTEPGLSQQIPTAEPDQPRPKAYPFLVNNLTGVADLIQEGDSVDVLSSFVIDRAIIGAGVGVNPTTQQLEIQPKETTVTGRSTKTLVQNVEVLRVIKPQTQPVNEEGTPVTEDGEPVEEQPAEGGEGEAPATDETGAVVEGGNAPSGNNIPAGSWILVLAVTDQEAEVIKFAQEEGELVTMVLRGTDDTAIEVTLGATLDILITQYGLPLPDPFVSGEAAPETPVPTVTRPL